jgi:serine protease Do
MKGVDLARFQFDYDLTWAAFFINADGTIYGRYGTRSIAGPMAHNSMESLKNAMKRALELHQNYPANRAIFAGKRGADPRWKSALDIPGLRKQFGKRLMMETSPKTCIHCHNIYDAWHETAHTEGVLDRESLWVYPLPDNIGMQIEVDSGNRVETVLAGSFAAKAAVEAGDVIKTMNGQPIISIADMQWVLHNLPKTAELKLGLARDGQFLTKTVMLDGEWKRSDISWRESIYSFHPKLRLWAPELSAEKKAELGISPTALALEAKWIPNESAKKAGLRNGDIIVNVGGNSEAMSHGRLNVWVKLNYHPGDRVPIQVLRGDEKLSLEIPLE